MIVVRAAWLLPIASPPVAGGWVAVEGGRIASVGGPGETPPGGGSVAEVDGAVLPGLVNAHTHLELSWMKGRVAPADAMPRWVEALMALRQGMREEPQGPIAAAVEQARACGTALVGDVTNTVASAGALARSPLSAHVFRELLGFNVQDGEAAVSRARRELQALPDTGGRLRGSVVPHAPYSVSPALLHAIAAASGDGIVSMHLAESAEELEFLRSGSGGWRSVLEKFGVWTPGWQAPGCGPVEYLDRFGLVTRRLLAVHGVQLTGAELARLAEVNATVVTCPRSNAWTGAGTPPLSRFYASGVRVAVGTDSLASVGDLNVFSEMAAIRAAAPDVPASSILASATRIGAEALGFGRQLGTIEPGKRAALIAVDVPPGVRDVEEYLVSGVQRPAIRWIAHEPRTLNPEP